MSPSIHFTAFFLEAFHSEISLRNVDVSVKRILIQYNNESLNKFLWKKVKSSVTLCCLLRTPCFIMKKHRFCLVYIFYKSLCRQITGMIRSSEFQCHNSKPSSLHLNTSIFYFMDAKTPNSGWDWVNKLSSTCKNFQHFFHLYFIWKTQSDCSCYIILPSFSCKKKKKVNQCRYCR